MESKLVLHTKTRHINVYAHPENVTHLTKEKMGTLNLQGGTAAYVKQFIDDHNQDESAHPYIQELIDTKADESDLIAHTSDTNNPHAVTKAQVGLGNADNTSDLNKPISTATQAALDGKQATISDLETIRSGAALGATAVQPGDLATVATTGDYDDLTNKPTIPSQASDVHALPDTTKYGASLDLNINSSTYIVTAQLKDQDGNALGTAQTIDLPLESVVVSGSYDSANKKVVLTLQNGSTVEFSVADLVAGLQSEITSSNKLSADLVDDTNTTHKFVTASDKSTWNGKQDAISDLATIRSGAAAGATALQPSVAASTYATKEEIADQYTESNLVPKSPVTFGKAQLTDFYTVVGSPTIEDGVLTNITANDYLSIGTYSGDTPTSIEIGSSFKTSNANVFGNAVIGRLTGVDTGIFWGNSSFPGKICFKHRVSYNNGATWTAVEIKSAALSLNTKYYVKFIISLAEQKLTGYVSTDNTNWTSYVANFNSGAILEGLTSIAIGKIFGHNASPLPIYLDYTYIKVNGKYWVPPLSSTVVSVSTMTGATSSAAGASGLVPAPAAGDETKFLRGDGTWVDSTSAAVWGGLTGTLSDQTDLQNALNAKQATISDLATIRSGASAGATAVQPGDLATVATSGSYNDLSNKPTIPTVDQTYSASSTNAQSGTAVASAISGKVDIADLSQVECIVETYHNGTSWYRVWSDGWCEQGGKVATASHQYGYTDVSLLKTMADTNYTITIGGVNATENGNYTFGVGNNSNITTSSFRIWDERTTGNNHSNYCYWNVAGYMA